MSNQQLRMERIAAELLETLRLSGASSMKLTGNSSTGLRVICAVAVGEPHEIEELDAFFEAWAARHNHDHPGPQPIKPFRFQIPPGGPA